MTENAVGTSKFPCVAKMPQAWPERDIAPAVAGQRKPNTVRCWVLNQTSEPLTGEREVGGGSCTVDLRRNGLAHVAAQLAQRVGLDLADALRRNAVLVG